MNFSATFNDNVSVTAFWVRPFNDKFNDYDKDGSKSGANYMGNVEMFGLVVPLSFRGVKVTPFGAVAAVGPNAFRSGSDGPFSAFDRDNSLYKSASPRYVRAGMLPAWGATGKEWKKLSSYATSWWGGLTADVTAANPFHFALDFTYGAVNYDSALNRSG